MNKKNWLASASAIKYITLIIVLGLVMFYAYYDEGIGHRPEGVFRIAYSSMDAENTDPIDVSKKLISSDADVIYVSDWSGENLDPIGILSAGYKVVDNSEKKGPHGVVLFAKNNINITSILVKNPITGPCSRPILTASLQYRNTLVTVLGVHVPAPIGRCQNKTDPSVKYFSTLIKNGKLAKNIGVGKKGDNVIMLGDLNSLPFNKNIVEIEQTGIEDAHQRVGHFLGATWTPYFGLPDIARIDYVFITPELNIRNLWNTRMPANKHNLLVADFYLP